MGWLLFFIIANKLMPKAFLSNFGEMVAFILRGIIGMGYRVGPKNSIALRIMFFVYLFTSNFIFLVYKANMTSALAVKSREKRLTSWEDVLISDYKIMLPRGSFIKEYLKTSKDPVEQAVRKKKVLDEEFIFNPNLPTLTSVLNYGVCM